MVRNRIAFGGFNQMIKRIFLLPLCLAAACSTPIPPPPPAPVPAPQAAVPAPAPVIVKAAVVETTTNPIDAFEQMRAALDSKSVYFAFDRDAIEPDQISAVTDHARLANDFSSDYVRLEGNCDERGGREYNLALGQQRADAVKKAMVLLGVAETRIETVSYGKERPRALCHEESCWSQNRRTDFVDHWK
jgi:peptidoglycan-associated lipoprotein